MQESLTWTQARDEADLARDIFESVIECGASEFDQGKALGRLAAAELRLMLIEEDD